MPVAVVPAFRGWRELTQKSPREKFLLFQFSPTPSDYIKEDSVSLVVSFFLDGEGNGSSLQYSCLENPMDRGAWRASVHGVTKSWTQLCVRPNTRFFLEEKREDGRWGRQRTVLESLRLSLPQTSD